MRFHCLAWVVLGISSVAFAEFDPAVVLKDEGFTKPPKVIEDTVNAPWWKNITGGSLNSSRTKLLNTLSGGMPPVALLGKDHRILGGFAVDMVAVRQRNLTTRPLDGFEIVDVKTGGVTPVQIPSGIGINGPRWSPDGTKVAFVGLTERESHLWVTDAATGQSRRVNVPLRLTGVTSFEWMADSRRIAVTAVPDNDGFRYGGDEPLVRMTTATRQRLRTHASLLESARDADLLEYVMTAQLALVDTANGSVKKVGEPAMYRAWSASADGTAFNVTVTERPFSYLVNHTSFPSRQEIIDADGKVVHTIRRSRAGGDSSTSESVEGWIYDYDGSTDWAEFEDRLLEQRQGGGQAGGPGSGQGGGQAASGPGNGMRSLGWHPDGEGLVYLQLEPQNRDNRNATRHDRVMRWKAPYREEDKTEVYRSETTINSVQFSEDGRWLFLTQTVNNRSTINAVDLEDGGKTYKVWEASTGDAAFYDSPGTIETKSSPYGGSFVVVSSAGDVFLTGTKYDRNPRENAPRPFADKVSIRTGEKTRVFESSADVYETVRPLNDDFTAQLISRESPTMYPQMFYVEPGANVDRQITQNIDYAPSLTQARTQIVDVVRADGFRFEVSVTLPRYSFSGEDKPAMFWFYPTEFTDQATYDRGKRNYNKNTFPRISASTTRHLLNLGYVVVNNDCPIVGPSEAPNDRFQHELLMNLSATIDALDKAKLIDRTRLAIGGHSYGGFGTANALIHTPYFKAGIAGAGNYNRSLTPFGFQREPRDIWTTREVYSNVSAMLHADKLNGALLMYHGMQDQNMGTDPQHSRRMYQALEALGKTASLYMYPYEDHGQIAYETRMDMWARWVAWLETYVKNPGSAPKEDAPNGDDNDGDVEAVFDAPFVAVTP